MTPEALRRFHEDLLRKANGVWFDFEGLIRDIYTPWLRPGDVAIDGGAHVGDHTFQMARSVAPSGRVIAFEPSPATLRAFMRECEKQPAAVREVIELRGTGLGRVSGTSPFHHVPDAPGLSSIMARPESHSYTREAITVRIERLDDVFASLPAARFMKLDLEGGEFDAFRGGRAFIARTRPVIVFEMDQASPTYFGYRLDELVEFFATLRYSVIDFFGNAYTTPGHYQHSLVWNLAALPAETDPAVVVDPVRRTLTRLRIRMSLGRIRRAPLAVYRLLKSRSKPSGRR